MHLYFRAAIEFFPELIGLLQMPGLFNLRFSIGISTTSGQQHSPVMKTDIIYQCESVIGDGLVKGPEKIISGCHQQSTVPDRVLFVFFDLRDKVIKGILLYAGPPISAGITANAAIYFVFQHD